MTRRVGVGLTAGPSLATIDAALVEIDPNPIRLKPVELIEFLPVEIPPDLQTRLAAVASGRDPTTAAAMSELDAEVGKLLADAVRKVAGARLGEVEFIGSCGIPIRVASSPSSSSSEEEEKESKAKAGDESAAASAVIRIGDARAMAEDLKTCVVSNFKEDDSYLFSTADAVLFRHLLDETHTVEWHRKPDADTKCGLVAVHVGAMGSMTALSGTGRVLKSFDCGPGNAVMDLIVANADKLGLKPKDQKDEALAEKLKKGSLVCDEDGKIAKGGEVYHGRTRDAPIDFAWSVPFFKRKPPRTGTDEDFGLEFTKEIVSRFPKEHKNVNDVGHTAMEHAALCIMEGIASYVGAVRGSGDGRGGHSGNTGRVLISGGGSRNWALMNRLKSLGWKNLRFETSSECGVRADAKQAMAAAVLGYLALSGAAGAGGERVGEGDGGGGGLGEVFTAGGGPAPVFEPIK